MSIFIKRTIAACCVIPPLFYVSFVADKSQNLFLLISYIVTVLSLLVFCYFNSKISNLEGRADEIEKFKNMFPPTKLTRQ